LPLLKFQPSYKLK